MICKSGETALGHKVSMFCIAEEMRESPEKAQIQIETVNLEGTKFEGEYGYNRYDNSSYVDWQGDTPEDWEDIEELADKLFYELEIATDTRKLNLAVAIELVKIVKIELHEELKDGPAYYKAVTKLDKLIKQLEGFK